jgi:fatty acid desaturase
MAPVLLGAPVDNSSPALRRAIDVPLNFLLVFVAAGGTLMQLFGVPFLLQAYGLAAIPVLLPIMLLQPLHWGLLHEALHTHLFPGSRTNMIVGRGLAILLGAPFEATRFSHLLHHRFSRHGYDRADTFDGEGSYVLAWIRYWGRLFGGVYLGILASPLFACVPPRLGVWVLERIIPVREEGDLQIRRLFCSIVVNRARRQSMRRDFAITLLLFGASAWMYGEWWPMFVAGLYLRGLWHSFADNVGHHAVELDEEERARNYSLPPLARLLVLNQNLHLTHHLHPNLPWQALAEVRVTAETRPHGNYFRAALRQADLAFPRTIATASGG